MRPSRRRPTATDGATDPADAGARHASSRPGPRPADGPENRRWRELLAEGGPILADGAMGTMLFADGLQFGDPPEVWNLAHPDVVRRIHRGYLDAGSRILMTNTFGGNRLRLGLHGLDGPRRRAQPDRRDPRSGPRSTRPAATRSSPATSARPARSWRRLGTLDYDEAVDVFAEQAAALIAGGVDLIWIETMSDLSEIKAAIEGVRRVSPGIAARSRR